MPIQILTIARNTFVESIRQPIYFVLVMLCGVLQFFTTWGTGFSMGYTESGEVSGDDKLQFELGLSSVFVCGMLLAALTATAVISREIENRTVLTVVSKPVARPSVVVGKYLGVAGSLLLAIVPMVIFLLMGLRHGVMTTAGDDPDQPVLLFSFLAIGLALATALWCNFFYGWYFSQTCMIVLAPGMVVAYVLVLLIGKKWAWQSITTDIKPQVLFACVSMSLAIFVLAAAATAVSTRLSQVMTIAVCVGLFLMGLLSNHLIGRRVFSNQLVGIVQTAAPGNPSRPGWDEVGSTYRIVPQSALKVPVKAGDPFYYSTSPSGFPMLTPDFPRFTGNLERSEDLFAATPSLVVTDVVGTTMTVRRIGTGALRAERPPQNGDYIFTRPTTVNIAAMGAWGMLLNLQHFWLVDAISQNQLIPFTHLGLIGAYGLFQIVGFLALGVVLFQKRDVG
ncbi:MAG: ABC transporter permease subunit [Phycisphaeraceae bacterium]|nr:ABC transporter permease subunit [Phycisphaeraceae bacterium]